MTRLDFKFAQSIAQRLKLVLLINDFVHNMVDFVMDGHNIVVFRIQGVSVLV